MRSFGTILALSGLLLATFMFYSGCKKEELVDPCIMVQVPEFHIEPNQMWMMRHSPGDTLHFKVYEKQFGKYVYQNSVSYVAADTFIERRIHTIPHVDHCMDSVPYYYYVQSFEGPEKLQCMIKPGGICELVIEFLDKEYKISSIQYDYQDGNWFKNYHMEGRVYSDVNGFRGYIKGSNPSVYLDSTYAFYNMDYGLLKIIDGKYVMQRYFP